MLFESCGASLRGFFLFLAIVWIQGVCREVSNRIAVVRASPKHHRPRVGLVPIEVLHAAIAVEEDDATVALPQGIMHPSVERDECGAVEPINDIAPGLAAGRGGDADRAAIAGAHLLLGHAPARGPCPVVVLRGGLGFRRGGLPGGRG